MGVPLQRETVAVFSDLSSALPNDPTTTTVLISEFVYQILKSCTPGTSEDGRCVSGVIPHEVERQAGDQPFVHGRRLAGAEAAVQVT